MRIICVPCAAYALNLFLGILFLMFILILKMQFKLMFKYPTVADTIIN